MGESFWHPFANMATVAGNELVIDRAEGKWLYDEAGKRYFDASGSLWYANLGHGRPEIADRVADQIRRLDAYYTFGNLSNRPAMELSSRLAGYAPLQDPRIFLVSGGGDAIDTAAKIARSHFALAGEPHRTHLISRTGGYHGTHGYGTSIGGIEPNVSGWGPLVPGTSVVAYDSVEALDREIREQGPETVAAFFCEPVIGAGGVFLPPDGYIEAVADLCAEHGVLFIVDAVICGFGRLGTWFGIERWPGVEPDMITFAKGVTGGYLPLGGVVASQEVAAPFWEGDGAMFRHGPTYAGHPVCCAAGLVTLDILESEGLLNRGQALEGELAAALEPLAGHPLVGEVRSGLGLLAAVEPAADWLRESPSAVADLDLAARERGVLVRTLGSSVAVSPPLTVDSSDLGMVGEVLSESLDAIAAG